MERFLFRLSCSQHASSFVLKGGLMLLVWRAPLSRPTMDIDVLGMLDNDVHAVEQVVKDICIQEVEPDGLAFDPGSVQGQVIAEHASYEGVRVRFRGFLGGARVTLQLDVGFGDAVVPTAAPIDYPAILDFPAPSLLGYSRESVVAEKFHAMVRLGTVSSRMNDFFDIWLLARQFDFDEEDLGTVKQQLSGHADGSRSSIRGGTHPG
ncbi:MAG: nucleotidyl transferase AbiEii/AbiGii toxin family protein [Thermoleophilia bacterium]|nr:nucleotidyl transferase AbiEii/AbiGii toxin family protein [Thermoleophilia bacterium]